jgi:prephenate dehydrogenase
MGHIVSRFMGVVSINSSMSAKRILFNQVTIVGLGLMGGSLGLDLRRLRLAKRVVGLSRSMSTVREAVKRGAIDEGTTVARRAVDTADLVVLATPVDTLATLAKKLVLFMPRSSILTDVGSTKQQVVAAVEALLPDGVAYVGSHPVCGSDRAGIHAAKEGLYAGTACVVTPTENTNKKALQRVQAFWEALGQTVVIMHPKQHDKVLAGCSHVPHLVASCLALAADPKGLPLTPKSLLEMTRLANGDPDLWDDILFSNRDAVLKAMQRFAGEWDRLYEAIAKDQRGLLHRLLARGQRKRKQFLQKNKP